MRGLRHLIPRETQDSLNKNPVFQWAVVALLAVVGVLLVVKGVGGVRDKRLVAKHGRVFEGTMAQVLGGLYVALGAAMTLGSLAWAVGSLIG